MSYRSDKPFKDREHMLWEVDYCNRTFVYSVLLCGVFLALGIISDILSMKLALSATTWLLLGVVAAILTILPRMHVIMARHLLGMEVIKKHQQT
jgi:hypothetical protein